MANPQLPIQAGGNLPALDTREEDLKKAEEQEEEKRIAQEKEWEIPAFLRKVKFRG